MTLIIGVIIGLFIGGCMGIFCSALMVAAKDREVYDNMYLEDEENE